MRGLALRVNFFVCVDWAIRLENVRSVQYVYEFVCVLVEVGWTAILSLLSFGCVDIWLRVCISLIRLNIVIFEKYSLSFECCIVV